MQFIENRRRLSDAVLFLLGAIVAPGFNSLGQTPQMLVDAGQAPSSLNGGGLPLGVVNGRLLFLGYQSNSGTELWRTDGTAAGTDMVIDIRPGPGNFTVHTLSSEPYYVWASMGGILYFNADDGSDGTQLWRTDGTANGTWRVKRLRNDDNGTSIKKMVTLGNRLVMSAVGTTIDESLWISDGTEAGTVEIPVQVSLGITGLSGFAEFEGDIVFTTSAGGLWRTNGTLAGTYQVKSSSISGTPHLCVWNNAIYFGAATPSYGFELWKSDGTTGGTALLCDINPGSSSGYPGYFTPLGNSLYFFGRDAVHGQELWKTDGTSAGTQLAVEFTPDTDPTNLADPPVPLNGGILLNLLYNSGPSTRLWMTDGTQAGTIPVTAPSRWIGQSFTTAGNVAYFAMGAGSSSDQELWRCDGTVAGTYRVRDVCPGSNGSFPRGLFTWGSNVYFTADDGVHGIELWRTDGTEAGTGMVADVTAGGTDGGGTIVFKEANGQMFFATGAYRLYGSDGSPAGTTLLKQHPSMTIPPVWANVGGTLMYSAQSTSGVHLWKSDGTGPGTVDVTPSYGFLDPRSIVDLNGIAIFTGKDPTLGYELFRSDGTESGTSIVKDIYSGSSNSMPSYQYAFGNIVLFFATTPSAGSELWRTDGTAAGTSMVLDICPGTASSSNSNYPPSFIEYNGAVYFTATDGVHNLELWRTDGTAAGTSMVIDLNPDNGSALPQWFAIRDGWLYFAGRDGQSNGSSLFRTDGTAAGTSLVRRFGTLTSDSYYVTELRAAADALYFAVYTGATTSPLELWRSDGTEAGTTLFRQIGPSFDFLSGQGPGLTVVDGQLYFPAWTPETGAELWTTDGTEAGTHAIEVAPGPASGNAFQTTLGGPIVSAAAGHYFYFLGNDGVNGLEPWAFVLPSRPYCPSDYNQDDFVSGDDFDAFVLDFELGLPAADVNHDTFVSGDDFDYFMDHFVAGC